MWIPLSLATMALMATMLLLLIQLGRIGVEPSLVLFYLFGAVCLLSFAYLKLLAPSPLAGIGGAVAGRHRSRLFLRQPVRLEGHEPHQPGIPDGDRRSEDVGGRAGFHRSICRGVLADERAGRAVLCHRCCADLPVGWLLATARMGRIGAEQPPYRRWKSERNGWRMKGSQAMDWRILVAITVLCWGGYGILLKGAGSRIAWQASMLLFVIAYSVIVGAYCMSQGGAGGPGGRGLGLVLVGRSALRWAPSRFSRPFHWRREAC